MAEKKIKLNVKLCIAAAFVITVFTVSFFVKRNCVLNHCHISELTETEKDSLYDLISLIDFERNQTIHKLPYKISGVELDIKAGSAILINCDTGDIIFEKNPDEEIPPASMTKLFLMYTVFQKISEGKVTLDTVIPLPPECWASHMPPHSSLMFLGKDQTVTLRELLTGLAVCSGNDASHAIAYYLFGSLDAFLEEVNNQIRICGLEKTHIVEPSGYSENNITTAREMASFARIYISKYPESLKLFHSVKKFVYPKPENIPEKDRGKPSQDLRQGFPDSIWTPIEQENTNKLLKYLEGCDGLKTGYIDESGYNLSLTCIRNGERYLSVTMKGPGNGIIEGDKFRQLDGKTLQDFAFNNFFELPEYNEDDISFDIPVLGAKGKCVKIFIPYDYRTCVPKKYSEEDIVFKITKPKVWFGSVNAAQKCGELCIYAGDVLIEKCDLVFDRSYKKANPLKRCFDYLVYKSIIQ